MGEGTTFGSFQMVRKMTELLLDLQWLYGRPRIDTEVESIHPRLLETFALHQRCS